MSKEEISKETEIILNKIRAKSKKDPKDEFGRRIFNAFEDVLPQVKDLALEGEPVGGNVFTIGEPFEGEPLIIASGTDTVEMNKITISNHNRMMVEIDTTNGELTFGEDYTFDETSHTFWTCMGKDSPTVLKAEIAELKAKNVELMSLASAAGKRAEINGALLEVEKGDSKPEWQTPEMKRVGVARLVTTIRRTITGLAKPFICEPNDQITRANLTSVIDKYLDTLKATRFIFDYTVVCDETNNPPEIVDSNQLKAGVAIQQIESSCSIIHIPLHIKPTIPKFVTDMDDEILADVIRNDEKNAYDEEYVNANSYDHAMKFIE